MLPLKSLLSKFLKRLSLERKTGNTTTSPEDEDTLHKKYPDLYTKWFNRGYESGKAAANKGSLKGHERAELEKLRNALKEHKKIFEQIRATTGKDAREHLSTDVKKLQDKVLMYKEQVKNLNQALTPRNRKRKHYVPPEDNQRIVKDSKFCVYCGAKAQTADHLIPRSRGGHDGYKNLAPACYACNQEKGNMTYNEYVTWRRHHYPELYE